MNTIHVRYTQETHDIRPVDIEQHLRELTVAELKEHLRSRKLPIRKTKAEMIATLAGDLCGPDAVMETTIR